MKKRFLGLFLTITLILSLCPVLSHTAAAAGTDWSSVSSFTPGDSYTIATADDLRAFAILVNAGQNGAGSTFYITGDIVLNDETFAFNKASGVVTVSDGTSTGYLGTGIPGTEYHKVTASSGGVWYTADALTSNTLTAGAYAGALDTWTQIGNYKDTSMYTYTDATADAYSDYMFSSWNNTCYYVSDPLGGYKQAAKDYDDKATYYSRQSVHATFGGTFDGGGHSISGLYINSAACYGGLFGAVSGATIKNVSVTKFLHMEFRRAYWRHRGDNYVHHANIHS